MTHIFYFSWSGKTRYCAEAAAQMLQCDITEITETATRKKSIFGFLKSGYEASTQKASEIRPLPVVDAEQIILAFPIWAGKIPPAVNTVLGTMDFEGRSVVVLNTMGGESKSAPCFDMVRDQIVQRGGRVVGFIRIVTGRFPEDVWKSALSREMKKLKLIE